MADIQLHLYKSRTCTCIRTSVTSGAWPRGQAVRIRPGRSFKVYFLIDFLIDCRSDTTNTQKITTLDRYNVTPFIVEPWGYTLWGGR